jgi:hypothetical protein
MPTWPWMRPGVLVAALALPPAPMPQACFFRKSPLFGGGKKKSEFPDAFVLSTLSEWAESVQEDVIVVN